MYKVFSTFKHIFLLPFTLYFLFRIWWGASISMQQSVPPRSPSAAPAPSYSTPRHGQLPSQSLSGPIRGGRFSLWSNSWLICIGHLHSHILPIRELRYLRFFPPKPVHVPEAGGNICRVDIQFWTSFLFCGNVNGIALYVIASNAGGTVTASAPAENLQSVHLGLPRHLPDWDHTGAGKHGLRMYGMKFKNKLVNITHKIGI